MPPDQFITGDRVAYNEMLAGLWPTVRWATIIATFGGIAFIKADLSQGPQIIPFNRLTRI